MPSPLRRAYTLGDDLGIVDASDGDLESPLNCFGPMTGMLFDPAYYELLPTYFESCPGDEMDWSPELKY